MWPWFFYNFSRVDFSSPLRIPESAVYLIDCGPLTSHTVLTGGSQPQHGSDGSLGLDQWPFPPNGPERERLLLGSPVNTPVSSMNTQKSAALVSLGLNFSFSFF